MALTMQPVAGRDYAVTLGASFQGRHAAQEYTSIRYDFKPQSVQSGGSGLVNLEDPGKVGEVPSRGHEP